MREEYSACLHSLCPYQYFDLLSQLSYNLKIDSNNNPATDNLEGQSLIYIIYRARGRAQQGSRRQGGSLRKISLHRRSLQLNELLDIQQERQKSGLLRLVP